MRDVKLGIKNDATHGANDEPNMALIWQKNKMLLWMQNMALHRKKNLVQQQNKYLGVILVAKHDAKKEDKIGANLEATIHTRLEVKHGAK